MEEAKRRKIWLVDDSPLQAELSRRAVTLDNDVRVFASGEAAIEAFASDAAPDLLLLDWHMPGIAGTDVCRFVRTTHDAASLPILVLTATESESTLGEAFRAGANDFLRKAAPVLELQARVASLLRTKDVHDALKRAEAALAVEAQFRERFMGMLAHDLRQPLNTFRLANVLLAAEIGAGGRQLLGMQQKASDRMTRMIAELLDFTRIRPETGMPIERVPMDLEALVLECIEQMRVGHPGRSFVLASDGPCFGRWDRDRLAQVCSNLIDNALAHGDTSSPIEITLTCSAGTTVLAVTNAGASIPDEMRKRLFEPFQRGSSAPRTTGSVGLGLHIVSEIARAHAGSVSVASDAGRTTFSVALPVEA